MPIRKMGVLVHIVDEVIGEGGREVSSEQVDASQNLAESRKLGPASCAL